MIILLTVVTLCLVVGYKQVAIPHTLNSGNMKTQVMSAIHFGVFIGDLSSWHKPLTNQDVSIKLSFLIRFYFYLLDFEFLIKFKKKKEIE